MVEVISEITKAEQRAEEIRREARSQAAQRREQATAQGKQKLEEDLAAAQKRAAASAAASRERTTAHLEAQRALSIDACDQLIAQAGRRMDKAAGAVVERIVSSL